MLLVNGSHSAAVFCLINVNKAHNQLLNDSRTYVHQKSMVPGLSAGGVKRA